MSYEERIESLLVRLERAVTQPAQAWFSIKGAAALTGLSPAHIRRAVTGGTLACSNVGSMDRPTYRISREDIEEWMKRRKAGALPPPKRKGRGARPGGAGVEPALPYSKFMNPGPPGPPGRPAPAAPARPGRPAP